MKSTCTPSSNCASNTRTSSKRATVSSSASCRYSSKAATEALKRYPDVNASIDGDDVVYHGYCDIGVAVSSDRGLVVPVLRNTEFMSLANMEAGIAEYADKARAGKLSIEEMSGGTFTVSNGGVFGFTSVDSDSQSTTECDSRYACKLRNVLLRSMVRLSYVR